jgi:hypothetical protein
MLFSVGSCIVAFVAITLYLKPQFVVHTKGAILLTGASSGIGLDAAEKLSSMGFTVIGTVRNQKDFQPLKVHYFIALFHQLEYRRYPCNHGCFI